MKTNQQDNRSGAVLICVLVCGLIAITLGASAVRLALGSARAGKQTLRLQQTQWLLEAGVRRSQLRISNGNYGDEIWQLPLGVLAEDHATVDIEVDSAAAGYLLVAVTAEYGPEAGSEQTIRRSYTYRQPR